MDGIINATVCDDLIWKFCILVCISLIIVYFMQKALVEIQILVWCGEGFVPSFNDKKSK